MIALGGGSFVIFSALAGLTLLMAANHVSPGCTGAPVQQCDYIASAKHGAMQLNYSRFTEDRGFEVFDAGSAVIVQQTDPSPSGWYHSGRSVLIDKKSCRVCEVGDYRPPPVMPIDPSRGRLILRTEPEDPVAAKELVEKLRRIDAGAPS